MMEWTLAGLFVISALLLIFSIIKSTQTAKAEHNQIDLIHISTMKEINAVQESIRNLELDIDVVMNKAGIQLSSDEKHFMREILDLHTRNYSTSSIAEIKQVSEGEIEELLAPFQYLMEERRKVANEN